MARLIVDGPDLVVGPGYTVPPESLLPESEPVMATAPVTRLTFTRLEAAQ